MKRLLTFAAAFFLSHQAAQATTFSLVADETPEHPAVILIKGQFTIEDKNKDVDSFTTIAVNRKKPAIVFLDSPGGVSWTGMQLGRIIRRHGFTTAVADDTQCTSACALAWLGGNERFMGANARIGFHAAKSNDKPEINGAANAVIGAYLYELGITDTRAIVYVTKAPPELMTWLTMTDAITYGIAAKSFSLVQDQWVWARPALGWRLPRKYVDPARGSFSAGDRKRDSGQAPILFSIKNGETLLLRNQTSVTSNCQPLFETIQGIDILEGPPELSLKAEPAMMHTSTTSGECPHQVPGVKVMVTASRVTEQKEATLIYRVRYQTKNGPWQNTGRFHMLMFPETKAASE